MYIRYVSAEQGAVDRYGPAAISRPAQRGHKAVVTLLIENGVTVDSVDKYDPKALSWSAGEEHDAVVKLLVEKEEIVKVRS